MKYILDFDRTLFDTDKFVQQLELDKVDYTVLVPELLDNYTIADYLYDDVLPFLQSKNKEDVIFLTALGSTYGPRILEYQKAKIEQEPIISLVGKIVYVDSEKGPAAAKIAEQFLPGESVVFVDDLIEQCLSVQQAVPQARCFVMVRRSDKYLGESSAQGLPIVRSLPEVDGMIENI